MAQPNYTVIANGKEPNTYARYIELFNRTPTGHIFKTNITDINAKIPLKMSIVELCDIIKKHLGKNTMQEEWANYNNSSKSEVIPTKNLVYECYTLFNPGCSIIFHIVQESHENYDNRTQKKVGTLCQIDLSVLSDIRDESNRTIIQNIMNDIDAVFEKQIEDRKNALDDMRGRSFFMLEATKNGFYLRENEIDHVKFFNTSIEDNYNDDFIPVNKKILERANKEDSSGIIILNGPPGTGKTSYIRTLIRKCSKNKKVIVFPQDLIHSLARPEFLPFLREHTCNSIFVVEDAESVLKKREELDNSNNAVITNILNSTDGILGDALKLTFIFSLNCQIDFIDPALLRKGRLIAQYEFTPLSKQKTRALINKLYPDINESDIPNKELTLAEIYNLEEEVFLQQSKRRSIGFT